MSPLTVTHSKSWMAYREGFRRSDQAYQYTHRQGFDGGLCRWRAGYQEWGAGAGGELATCLCRHSRQRLFLVLPAGAVHAAAGHERQYRVGRYRGRFPVLAE